MRKSSGNIVTVTGIIPADETGPTLAHEHLYCDISIHSGRPDNILTDVDLMIHELEFFRKVGGRTIVEVTPEGLGRDPAKLRVISETSGVQIVAGIAFYESSTYPAWVRPATGRPTDAGKIADYFVRQIEEGTAGVCAGVIGELTSHNEPKASMRTYCLDEDEKAVFEAAALAQQRTGVGITTHAALGRGGHAQLDVLERAGADLHHVAIGHCDAHWSENPDEDMAYYLPILKRGAFCEFDLIGWHEMAPDDIRADRITALIQMGFAERILLSTDTCRQSYLHGNGGRGYDYLWTSFLPRLCARGITPAQIKSMLVTAPQNLLAVR